MVRKVSSTSAVCRSEQAEETAACPISSATPRSHRQRRHERAHAGECPASAGAGHTSEPPSTMDRSASLRDGGRDVPPANCAACRGRSEDPPPACTESVQDWREQEQRLRRRAQTHHDAGDQQSDRFIREAFFKSILTRRAKLREITVEQRGKLGGDRNLLG